MSDIQDFQALGLSEEMLSALALKGFKAPSPIQALTIPKLLTGTKDLIGQAQTGTGKTAAFGIPIIENAEEGCKKPQALILAPTRELSMQIAEEINSFKGDRKLRIASFYGGQNIEIQLQLLRQGNMDIIIGTFATFVAASTAYLLRNVRFFTLPVLSSLMPVLTNGILIGLELELFLIKGPFHFSSFLLQGGMVAIGEFTVCVILGLPFFKLLQKFNIEKALQTK